MKLTKANAVKRNLFFSFDALTCPADAKGNGNESVFNFLRGLEEDGFISMFLAIGVHEDKASEKIAECGIEGHFKKENIFRVGEDYINSKGEIDRERHLAQLDKDPFFDDKFFKQRVIMDLIAEGKITREDTCLIGHDIWFDAFYSTRFSGVDFFLVESLLSERNRPIPEKIQGLNYISFNEADLKKIILGKFPEQDTRFLQTYIFNKLKLELFEGTKIDSLVKKSVLNADEKTPDSNQ